MSTAGSYRLRIKSSAEKEMDALPKGMHSRLVAAILGLENSPRPLGCKKLKTREEYRIRIGNYRVLYTIDDRSRVVEIFSVSHRKDAYR
jgi:mRNA interferase RelE/StbE